MGKEFEIRLDAETGATPDQVWDAVATGPGISAWLVGRTEVDGETVRTSFGDGWIPAGTVTGAEPGHRFAHRTATAPDGRFLAHEYLIEGRDSGATVLRAVTSGFLPGDDWAGEFEAMGFGTTLFFATLVEYLRFFPARAPQTVTLFGPPVHDWPAAWQQLHAALGLGPAPRPGDQATGGPLDGGVVYFSNPHTLGVRTPHGLFRFIRGLPGVLVLDHATFPGGPATTAGRTTDWQRFIHEELT